MLRHLLQPRGVAVDGQALVGVVEVAIVERVAHRQARDDLRRQLGGVGLPLLGGVVLHKRVVERLADQRNAALLQVRRGCGVEALALLLDERLRFLRRVVAAEELVDQAQPHGELVRRAVVHGKDAVLVVREIGEAVDVLPHALVGSVEQVRTVLVHLDAGFRLVFAVGVAADVAALFHHQDAFAQLARRLLGHGEAEETRSNNYEVVCHAAHFRTVAYRRSSAATRPVISQVLL